MDQVTQLLQRLADQFGVSVQYLWPLLVNYTRWMSLAWLIIDALLILMALIVVPKACAAMARHSRLYNNRGDAEYVDYALHGTWATVAFIVIVIAVAIATIGLLSIPDNLAGFIVPEARAIFNLLKQLTGK